jgi:hypothetical protein
VPSWLQQFKDSRVGIALRPLWNRTGIYCGLCCLVPVIAVIWFLRRASRPDKPDRPGPEPDGRHWQRR